jgi:chitin synthase
LSIAQYVFVGILSFLVVVQVACSLIYIARRPQFVKEEDMQAGLLVMVPCYNESDKELRKTVDSVLENDYPDDRKLLVIVADGVITGAGETMSCPETLASLLGFDFDPSDAAYPYNSLGANTTNYASIYSGIYTSRNRPEKKLNYIVIVKQGCPQERFTPRAGNRGKRDSQILLFGILNRLQYGRRLKDLDQTFIKTLDAFGLCHQDIKYLMAIDADTRVSDTSLKFLVHKLEKDKSILACCGETRVDNKVQSFVTMMQVFEYYSAHHLKKAFESVFGCVTCLPGCFTLYRLYTEELEPLLTSDVIVSNYARNDISSLHERNLYELGEDRMLTTLLLQHFYGMKLSFVPEAVCWTIVPHTFQILKSQRRRWINSTVHNMLELLKVQTMCGVCFFSMKMVVIFDLLSTFLLPSGCIYLYYIIIDAIMNSDGVAPLAILAFAFVGLMMVPFVMRAQWDYFLWFIVFVLGGVPTFYFYLPVYSFWHMDDLSWGKTRQVKQDNNNQEERKVEMGGDVTAEETASSNHSSTARANREDVNVVQDLAEKRSTSPCSTTVKKSMMLENDHVELLSTRSPANSCTEKKTTKKARTRTDGTVEDVREVSTLSFTASLNPKKEKKKKKKIDNHCGEPMEEQDSTVVGSINVDARERKSSKKTKKKKKKRSNEGSNGQKHC